MKTQGGFLMTQIKQVGSRVFEQMLREYGVSAFNGAQGKILYVLWEYGELPITGIAKYTSLAKTTLTSMLERMEDAFWDMLAEMPYHQMTGRELRARAGVSHNTFYYHFANMDDMARDIFDRLAAPEVPAALMGAVMGGVGTSQGFAERVPGFELRFARMRLLAASGSPLLVGFVRDAVVRAWLSAIGLAEDDLTTDDRIDLTYAFGGIIALFGSDLTGDPQAMAAFSRREMGQAVFTTMRQLADRAPGR